MNGPIPRRILIASGWHDINIGDIAHTPGLLGLLRQHCPQAELTFWPHPTLKGPERTELAPETLALLKRHYPEVRILKAGGAQVPLPPGRADLVQAFAEADLLVVNSGGFHPAPAAAWCAATGKPYIAFGCSFSPPGPEAAALLNQAAFLGCRDSGSRDYLQAALPAGAPIAFSPDAVFAFRDRDEDRASALLARTGVGEAGFLCVIPRLRYSPYPAMYRYEPSAEEQEHARVNDQFRHSDHAILRDLITRWVRETGRLVLACPEMTYGLELARVELVESLPADIRAQVGLCEHFWMPDEAAAVFARAAMVVSLDCHSPIIALANGTPAIHIRLPTDHPTKWRMFADIGLPDWVWRHETIDGERLFGLVRGCIENPAEAKRKLERAMETVRAHHAVTLDAICGAPAHTR